MTGFLAQVQMFWPETRGWACYRLAITMLQMCSKSCFVLHAFM